MNIQTRERKVVSLYAMNHYNVIILYSLSINYMSESEDKELDEAQKDQDGYFEGKFEPVKYTRGEVHTNEPVEDKITDFANKIRIKLNQTSLAYEFNNQLVLVSE